MAQDKHKDYLSDLGYLLKERAKSAKENRDKEVRGSEDYIFESGRLMAYYEVISLMQDQAKAFGIPLKDLRLEDIVPDRDFI